MRNNDTLNKFLNLANVTGQKNIPLFYFKAILATKELNEFESVQFAKFLISQNPQKGVELLQT